MITSTFEFNEDAFRRRILESVEEKIRSRLWLMGIHNVTVRAVRFEGEGVRLEFSGEAADIQRAKAAIGYQA